MGASIGKRRAAILSAMEWMMELGWLLDDGVLCVGAGWNGFVLCSYSDVRAIRFARYEDAERVRYVLSRIGVSLTASRLRPVEHAWSADMPRDHDV
jgi:hypothetical protein